MCFVYFSTGRYFPLAPYRCALILLQTYSYALYDTRGMCSCSLSISSRRDLSHATDRIRMWDG